MVRSDPQQAEAEQLQLIKKLVDAMARLDGAGVRACLTPDVVLNTPGETLLSGTFRGIEDVMEALTRFAEIGGEDMELRLHDAFASDEHGVVLYDVKARRDGKAIVYDQVDIYHFRDGLISEITVCQSDGFRRLWR
jgi:ketosteroid isomerase-like protein